MKFLTLTVSALIAIVHASRSSLSIKASSSSRKKSGKKICLQYGIEKTITGRTSENQFPDQCGFQFLLSEPCDYQRYQTCRKTEGGYSPPFLFSAGLDKSSFLFTDEESTRGDCAFKGSVGAEANKNDKIIIRTHDPTHWGTNTLKSISYDFFPKNCGKDASSCYNQIYLNVYTYKPKIVFQNEKPYSSFNNTFYDCRYDYVPQFGPTNSWSTFLMSATSEPTHVESKESAECPSRLSEAFAQGFQLGIIAGINDKTNDFCKGQPVHDARTFVINMGDTENQDNGLIAYINNVQVTYAGELTIVYDFECE